MKRRILFSALFLAIGSLAIAQNVGIGTTTPAYDLHITKPTGNVYVWNSSNDASALTSYTLSAGFLSDFSRWGNSASGSVAGISVAGLTRVWASGGGLLLGTGSSSGPVYFSTNNTERMRIASDGNVGIGTTTPQDKLHVTGGNIFINSATGGLKLGYPGTTGANFWEFITIGGGAHIRMRSTSETGTVRLPFWFGQQGFLGINLDTLSDPEPKYALHVAARNKYAVYGIANQFGSDTVAGVVGFANSPTPVPFSAGVRGESNSTNFNGIGVIGIQRGGGWGVAGFAKELGGAGYGAGLYGAIGRGLSGGTGTGGFGVLAENYNASGIAGSFRNYGGTTGKALQTSGGVQLTGIGEGADKVLTSDASGNATWQAAPLAFVHKATASNVVSGYITILSYTNPLQTDIVMVTHNYNPVGGPSNYFNHTVGVYWNGSAWAIYSEDTASPIVNTTWNVVVYKQ